MKCSICNKDEALYKSDKFDICLCDDCFWDYVDGYDSMNNHDSFEDYYDFYEIDEQGNPR